MSTHSACRSFFACRCLLLVVLIVLISLLLDCTAQQAVEIDLFSLTGSDSLASAELKPTAIMVALIHWNSGLPVETENSMFTISKHPAVASLMRSTLSSVHHSRNILLRGFFEHHTAPKFTHLLFFNQDVVFEPEDLDHLLKANKDVIAGVGIQRFSRELTYIPLPTDHKSKLDRIQQETEPFEVHAIGFDFALVNIEVLKKSFVMYGDKKEWFWLGDRNPSLPIRDEDLTFCEHLKTLGHKVWIHPLAKYDLVVPALVGFDRLRDKSTIEATFSLLSSGKPVVNLNKYKEMPEFVADPKFRVVIATPIWEQASVNSAMDIWNFHFDRFVIGRVTVSRQTIVTARNELMRKICEEFGDNFTHVLFVDGDMTFAPGEFYSLLVSETDIVMGVAVKRQHEEFPPAFIPLGHNPRDYKHLIQALTIPGRKPLVEIKAGGMAFTLVRRQVFEKVKRKAINGNDEWFWCEHVYDEETGMKFHYSEDYTFMHRARLAGYKVYVDPNCVVGHMGDRVLGIKDWLNHLGVSYSSRSGQ